MRNSSALSPRRLTSLALAVVTAGLLAACALEPGRPYDFSQVNGGFINGEANSGPAAPSQASTSW